MSVPTASATKTTTTDVEYVLDWTTWLAGDTIATSVWTLPTGSGLTQHGASILAGNAKTQVWLSGGTVAAGAYEVVNTITTAAGRTEKGSLWITVRSYSGTWTYTGNPATSRRDAIRFLMGDVDDSQPWTLNDMEIDYCATLSSNDYQAAAYACDNVVSKVSGLITSKSIGDLSISYSARFTQFQQKARDLRTRATLGIVSTYATGLTVSDKESADDDSERIQPAARIDGMNNPAPIDPSTTSEQ